MRLIRTLTFIIAVSLLASCKIKIIVPVEGSVITSSGAFSCGVAQICFIDVVDFFFDETFIAKPMPGYEFVKWEFRDRGLCGGKTPPCHLYTDFFEGMPAFIAFLESDEVFVLKPIFKMAGT